MDILKLILPDLLVDHFDLTSYRQEAEVLHLYFEEHNHPPLETPNQQLVSKGFQDEITIQDFLLRGKNVFLHIKRRRWTDKQTNKIVQRDWNLVAKGSRIHRRVFCFFKRNQSLLKHTVVKQLLHFMA